MKTYSFQVTTPGLGRRIHAVAKYSVCFLKVGLTLERRKVDLWWTSWGKVCSTPLWLISTQNVPGAPKSLRATWPCWNFFWLSVCYAFAMKEKMTLFLLFFYLSGEINPSNSKNRGINLWSWHVLGKRLWKMKPRIPGSHQKRWKNDRDSNLPQINYWKLSFKEGLSHSQQQPHAEMLRVT